MRKLSITLALVFTSIFAVNASILEYRMIIFQDRIWDTEEKGIPLLPINAFIEANSHILVEFLNETDQAVTFQIKDCHGNIIFNDQTIPDKDASYKIYLDDLKPGEYELIYLDNKIRMSGKFNIE